jgi:hypothetical protein
MPYRPIDRIRAKVERAEQNIADFDLRLRDFRATKPYSVGTKEDPEAGKRTYYLVSVRDIPLNVETIAANVIQDLRDPLDHLAFQLEKAAADRHRSRKSTSRLRGAPRSTHPSALPR